jgi:hypothetical protein
VTQLVSNAMEDSSSLMCAPDRGERRLKERSIATPVSLKVNTYLYEIIDSLELELLFPDPA